MRQRMQQPIEGKWKTLVNALIEQESKEIALIESFGRTKKTISTKRTYTLPFIPILPAVTPTKVHALESKINKPILLSDPYHYKKRKKVLEKAKKSKKCKSSNKSSNKKKIKKKMIMMLKIHLLNLLILRLHLIQVSYII